MRTEGIPRIGHTDIAGDLGGRVTSRLAERNVEVTADLDDVETLFLVPVHERVDRVAVQVAVVDSAVAAGVRHIIYASFLNTSPTATFTLSRDHYATEQHIRASGAAFTFLRASAYLEVAHYLLGADDVIRGPAGTGRVAFVGKDDMADVAVTVLVDPSPHVGATYDLTGPMAVSLYELTGLRPSPTSRVVGGLRSGVTRGACFPSLAACGGR
ncbi:MAG TPA: NmrA family NAD(P)-binding protein [Bacteroidales bacterium]|nr:NmrA family NAD(P)-binding protein [Bacteroidales bacterium]